MDSEARNYSSLLEAMLLDASAEPINLPLPFLKAITNNFSDDKQIGEGGFAVVYKGQLRNETFVAVKKLQMHKWILMGEEKFNKEVYCLMPVKHKNVVRFLGYCADTQGQLWKIKGNNIMADVRQRLLCFEFLPNGSLDKYITDASEGLEWITRYRIIRGICEGLHHLHQKRIVHSDLKPANILLDNDMTPKIADFGLSRLFGENKSQTRTSNVPGTMGYIAPELCRSGVITYKIDIYSLGVTILEILTGHRWSHQIENVLESWSTRLKMQGGVLLEQVKICAEIGIECMKLNPEDRPTTQDILNTLEEMESVLEVHPLEVCFPLDPNKHIKRPVTLTNRTDHHLCVWITPTYPDTSCSQSHHGFPYLWEKGYPWEDDTASLLRELGPCSSMVINMTMKEHPQLQAAHTGMFEVLMFTLDQSEISPEELKHDLSNGIRMNRKSDDLLETFKKLGTEVHRATLKVVAASNCDDPEMCQEVVTHQLLTQQATCEFGDVVSFDVHPIKTWVLVGHEKGYASIWNYNSQEKVKEFNVTDERNDIWRHPIYSTKFIAAKKKKWFAAGDGNGYVHVYAYDTKEKLKEFEAHYRGVVRLLAAHPTNSWLLSTNGKSIKLWNWEQDWLCTRVFDVDDDLVYLTVCPRDTNTFASGSCLHSTDAKVWNIHYTDPLATFKGSKPAFYTDDRHLQFLVTTTESECSNYYIASIWDLQTKKRVHTLRYLLSSPIYGVACHPVLPVLAIITKPYYDSSEICLHLWDTKTYRLMKRVQLFMDGYITCLMFNGADDLTRLVVASEKNISIVNINMPVRPVVENDYGVGSNLG